jgi:hypothetical protein
VVTSGVYILKCLPVELDVTEPILLTKLSISKTILPKKINLATLNFFQNSLYSLPSLNFLIKNYFPQPNISVPGIWTVHEVRCVRRCLECLIITVNQPPIYYIYCFRFSSGCKFIRCSSTSCRLIVVRKGREQ